MPETRITSTQIAALKAWMTDNKEELLSRGINRIDACYTDNDLSTRAFDEFATYSISNSGSAFTEVPFSAPPALREMLEEVAENDGFFTGGQGGGGEVRLLINTGVIEHQAYEYVTTKIELMVERY